MGQSLNFNNKGKNNFTLVRICLAFIVLTGHGIALMATKDYLFVSIASGIAVYSFFGISGFLLNNSIMATTPKTFIVKRFARILPGFYSNLIIVALVMYPISNLLTRQNYSLVKSIKYIIQNSLLYPFNQSIEGALQFSPRYESWNNSVWTLSFEFLCYLSLVIFSTLLKSRLSLVFALIVLLQFVLMQIDPSIIVDKFRTLMELSSYFFIGVAMSAKKYKLIFGFLLIEVLFSTFESNPGFMLVVMAVVSIGNSRAIIEIKNDLSYGIYLYHFPIFQMIYNYQVFKGIRVNFFLAFCVTTLISTAISYASWKKIEKPAIDLAKNYREFANE